MTAVEEKSWKWGKSGRLPPSKMPDWNEEEYQSYFDRDRIWWPWWVAIEFYWRKTGIVSTRCQLFERGSYSGGFKCCSKANAPSRQAPVDRASFMNWVCGKSEKKDDKS